MPLYEYQCANDGTFELIQKFSDPPLTACPKCGGPVEKLLSAPAIQFKGSGWYITDYARKSTGGGESGKEKGGESGKDQASSSEKSEKSSEKKDGGSGSSTTSSAPSTGSSSGASGSSGASSGGGSASSGSGDKK